MCQHQWWVGCSADGVSCVFQIVYVAPMKALAAEMVRNFGGRLQPLGIAVRELTGDMSLTKQEILKTQVGVFCLVY